MRIDFLKPDFEKGINSTVRKGIRSFNVGDSLELYKTGAELPTSFGEVIGVLVTDLFVIDLFPELLKYQHDKETRTYYGLINALHEAYDKNLSTYEPMTIIYFDV